MTRSAVPSPHPTTFVNIAGGRRALIDLAGPGQPVLLVPGYLGSKEDFTPVLDGIAAGGHRVVALDLAGQWESEGSDDPADYTPPRLAADLPQVLDALGIDRAHLLGHSYGGLVARAAVLAAPARWSSLVLLCSGPGQLQGDRRPSIDLMRQVAAVMELSPLYDALLDYWASHGDMLPPPEAADFQRERFTGGRIATLLGMATGLLEEEDGIDALLPVLAGNGLPVSVVYGDADDAWLPPEQDAMAARLGVSPVVIPGAGHSPAYDLPGVLVRILLDFWRAATGPSVHA